MPTLYVPDAQVATLSEGHPARVVRLGAPAVTLLSVPWGRGTRHLLIAARQEVRVNGALLIGGAAFLRGHSEITGVADSPIWYSIHGPLEVVPAPAEDPTPTCMLCWDPVAAGSPAVRCPACRHWFHGYCWASCASCPTPGCTHPTDCSWQPGPGSAYKPIALS